VFLDTGAVEEDATLEAGASADLAVGADNDLGPIKAVGSTVAVGWMKPAQRLLCAVRRGLRRLDSRL
jgi:hypothetical protein